MYIYNIYVYFFGFFLQLKDDLREIETSFFIAIFYSEINNLLLLTEQEVCMGES